MRSMAVQHILGECLLTSAQYLPCSCANFPLCCHRATHVSPVRSPAFRGFQHHGMMLKALQRPGVCEQLVVLNSEFIINEKGASQTLVFFWDFGGFYVWDHTGVSPGRQIPGQKHAGMAAGACQNLQYSDKLRLLWKLLCYLPNWTPVMLYENKFSQYYYQIFP